MKKFLALMLALVLALSLAACGQKDTGSNNGNQGGDNQNSAQPSEDNQGGDASQYPEYFAGMDDLIAAAQAEGELVVYGSCEEEYLAAACAHVEEVFGI